MVRIGDRVDVTPQVITLGWIKAVESIDTEHLDGWAYVGPFLSDPIELPIGQVVVQKYPRDFDVNWVWEWGRVWPDGAIRWHGQHLVSQSRAFRNVVAEELLRDAVVSFYTLISDINDEEGCTAGDGLVEILLTLDHGSDTGAAERRRRWLLDQRNKLAAEIDELDTKLTGKERGKRGRRIVVG